MDDKCIHSCSSELQLYNWMNSSSFQVLFYSLFISFDEQTRFHWIMQSLFRCDTRVDDTRISTNSSCEIKVQMACWSAYFRCILHSSRAWSGRVYRRRRHSRFQSWQLNSSWDKHATIFLTAKYEYRMWRQKILIFDRCCDFISRVISIGAEHMLSLIVGMALAFLCWFWMSRRRNRRRSEGAFNEEQSQMNKQLYSVCIHANEMT